MAASYETVDAILAIIRKHVSEAVFRQILAELSKVPGNHSFKETVARMVELTHERH